MPLNRTLVPTLAVYQSCVVVRCCKKRGIMRLYRATRPDGGSITEFTPIAVKDNSISPTPTALRYTDYDIKPGNTYYYKVTVSELQRKKISKKFFKIRPRTNSFVRYESLEAFVHFRVKDAPKNGLIYTGFNTDQTHPIYGGHDRIAEGAKKNREYIRGLFDLNHIAITEKSDLTYREFQDALKEAFQTSTEHSYNYVYLCCHGNTGGLYLLQENKSVIYIEFSNIVTWLKGIPGHFILLIDACQSGGLANDSYFGNYPDKFRVICSSLPGQDTYGNESGNCSTIKWVEVSGYDINTKTEGTMKADTNADGKVSLEDIANATLEDKHFILGVNKTFTHDDTYYPHNDYTRVLGKDI